MIVKLLLSLIFAIFGGMGLAISLDGNSISEKLLFSIGGLASLLGAFIIIFKYPINRYIKIIFI